MATRIYFSNRLETLTEHLATRLASRQEAADPFAATTIIVPNPHLKKWLQLEIARRHGIAANLDFQYLEQGVWGLLGDLDEGAPARLLDQRALQLAILGVFRTQLGDAALAPFQEYLEADAGEPAADYARRAWQLAGKLAGCFREYEYHRREMVRAWVKGERFFAAEETDAATLAMVDCQAALYRAVFNRGGAVDRLAAAGGQRLLTLPRYAHKVLARIEERPVPEQRRELVIFGLDQISPFHRDLLYRLGRVLAPTIYQLNVCAEFWEDVTTPAEDQLHCQDQPGVIVAGPTGEELADIPDENRLLKLWGKPGRENLKLLSELENRSVAVGEFFTEWLPATEAEPAEETVLHTVQRCVLQRIDRDGPAAIKAQDASIQVVGCPDVYREMETVYQSILSNMQSDPTLKLTDIAILVSDLRPYKAAIQAVFHRRPRIVPYNLADSSASADSAYAQAVLAAFELAAGAFTRREFFQLVFNPCFLAARRVDRETAGVWLEWADKLNMVYCYDEENKARQGYPANDRYTWSQGLRRLRLGRVMQPPPDEPAADGFREFRGVVPFADMQSQDADRLSSFCLAVELLWAHLRPWRDTVASGVAWAERLRRLLTDLLEVPADRPEEEAVRQRLLESLDHLADLDAVAGEGDGGIDLPMVREFVSRGLDDISSRHGSYLTGGVTIALLAPNRPIPFRLVYLVGLGEGEFAARSEEAGLDLRSARRRIGDIDPQDAHRYAFLESVVSARDKLYISYVSKQLQKDEIRHPCSVVMQLTNYLTEHVLADPFRTVQMPLSGSSDKYLQPPPEEPPWQDVMVNYSVTDALQRLLSLRARSVYQADEQLAGELAGAASQIDALVEARAPTTPPGQARPIPTASREQVGLRELTGFLTDPAIAAMRRHLGLYDAAEDDKSLVEDEPFFSSYPLRPQLVRETLRTHVDGARGPDDSGWAEFFEQLYDDSSRRGKTPDGAFAAQDRASLREAIAARLQGGGRVRQGLGDFLDQRREVEFIAAASLGDDALTGDGVRRYPAVQLQLESTGEAGETWLRGGQALLWQDPRSQACETLVVTEAGAPERNRPPRQVLGAFLFYLAALAGTEPGEDGRSSAAWIGGAPFTIHLAHRHGISSWTYELDAERALAYLEQLTADFLQPDTFDLLPFEVLTFYTLRRFPQSDATEAAAGEQAEYADSLQSVIDDLGDAPWSRYRASPLAKLGEPRVPADAYEKVRRRFRPFFAAG